MALDPPTGSPSSAPLQDRTVIAAVDRAWRESEADDATARHEEGGYIMLNEDMTYGVERWPRGGQSGITPPLLDTHNCYNGKVVIATFHTHPNPPVDEIGREWDQGPSESDRRWHRRRKLRGFVVSEELVYQIDATANVSIVGKRDEVLS
jgi:hypothetical protein